MGEWQSIETAPKDTAVLVYAFSYEVAHFNTQIGFWVACWDHRKIREPVGWMPLPPAPPPRTPHIPAPVTDEQFDADRAREEREWTE